MKNNKTNQVVGSEFADAIRSYRFICFYTSLFVLVLCLFSPLSFAVVDQSYVENHTQGCENHVVSSDDHTSASCQSAGIEELVGYWKLDETTGVVATDSSGNNYDGDIINGFTSVTGKVSTGFKFNNASAQYVNVENATKINQITDAMTVSVWVKSYIEVWNKTGALVSKRNQFILSSQINTKRLLFYIFDQGSSTWVNWEFDLTTLSDFDLRDWHHYAVTYDRIAGEVKIYVDGIERLSASASHQIATDSGPLNIGKDESIANRYLKGSFDEVRIYNYALPPEEIGYFSTPADPQCVISDNLGGGRYVVTSKQYNFTGPSLPSGWSYRWSVDTDALQARSWAVNASTYQTLQYTWNGAGKQRSGVKLELLDPAGDVHDTCYTSSENGSSVSNNIVVHSPLTATSASPLALLVSSAGSTYSAQVPPFISELNNFVFADLQSETLSSDNVPTDIQTLDQLNAFFDEIVTGEKKYLLAIAYHPYGSVILASPLIDDAYNAGYRIFTNGNDAYPWLTPITAAHSVTGWTVYDPVTSTTEGTLFNNNVAFSINPDSGDNRYVVTEMAPGFTSLAKDTQGNDNWFYDEGWLFMAGVSSITASKSIAATVTQYWWDNKSLSTCTVPLGASCSAILGANRALVGVDGEYCIDPDGASSNAPFTAYCDMTTDGGGWTRVIKDSTTTLTDLKHLGDTVNIAGTFYNNASYGVGWGTNNTLFKVFEIEDIPFNEYRITMSGFYDTPTLGLGYLAMYDTSNQGISWGGATQGVKSLKLTDSHTNPSYYQYLEVQGSIPSGQIQRDVINETYTVPAYSPFIQMAGYTSSYPYTKRYINELWVRDADQLTEVIDFRMDEGSWDGTVGEVKNQFSTQVEGKAVNGAVTIAEGKICRAAEFDGLNDYVSVPGSPSMEYSGGDMTISTWVYIDPTEIEGDLFSKSWNYTGEYNYSARWNNGSIIFGLLPYSGVTYSITTPLTTSAWHHLTFVADSAKNMHIYVDGQLAVSGQHAFTAPDWIPSNGNIHAALAIGTLHPYDEGWAGREDFSLKGKMDEFLFYKKALNATEIQTIYDNQSQGLNADGSTRTCQVLANPVADWRMDEQAWTGAVDEVNDQSGNYHDANITGEPKTYSQVAAGGGICRVAGDLSQAGSNISVEATNGLDFDGSYTFSAWLKAPNGNYGHIANRTAGTVSDIEIYIGNGLTVVHNRGNGGTLHHRYYPTPPDDVWFHLTVSFSLNNGIQVYYDGVLQTATVIGGTLAAPIASSGASWDIGHIRSNWIASPKEFPGQLDEVLIYDQELTIDQIQTLYNNQSNGLNADGSPRICADDIKADWRMDETQWEGVADEVIDHSSNDYHGVGRDITTDPGGKICSAGDFSKDGITDYVDVDPQALNGLNNFSISSWFKTDKPYQSLISGAATGGSGNELTLYVDSPTEILIFLDYTGVNPAHYRFDVPDYTDNQWHHVVWSRIANNNCLYLDGIKAGCTTTLTTRPLEIEKLIIGQEQDSLGGGFDAAQDFEGLIDETIIYGRGLLGDEVINLFNNQTQGLNADGSERDCSYGESRTSCAAWLAGDQSLRWKDGAYWLDPDGNGGAAPFRAWCDMSTDGGGWTVFQHRETDSDFYRYWDDYKQGFGSVESNHWLGNDRIHALTATGNQELYVDLTRYTGETRQARYSSFDQSDEANKYQLTINGYSGDAGDSLAHHNNRYFTTRDSDNDLHASVNCARTYKGAWWYGQCHTSNLNGQFLDGTHVSYADGMNWHLFAGFYDSMVETTMMLRGAETYIKPVAEWRMDKTVWDGSTGEVKDQNNTYSGIAVDGATTSADGFMCRAGEFDGTNDLVDVTINVSENPYAVSFWFKTAQAGDGLYSVVAGLRGSGSSDRHLYLNSTGGMCARVYTNETVCSSGRNYADDQWHHVVHVLDGTNQIVYVDGYEQVRGNKGVSTFNWSDSIHFGYSVDSVNDSFTGKIDEALIYDQALSSEQVFSLYTNQNNGKNADGTTRYCPVTVTPIADWHMDEYSGITVSDSVGDNDLKADIATFEVTPAPIWNHDQGQVCGSMEMQTGTGSFIKQGLSYDFTKFAVSFWLKPKTLEDYSQSLGAYWGKFHFHSSADGSVYVGTDAATRMTPSDIPAGTVELNRWQHFTFSFDNGVGKFYKDGVLLAEKSGMALPATWTEFIIYNNGSGGLKGDIDELMLFDTSLSDSDVTTLFTNQTNGHNADGSPRICEIDLAGEWRMDETDWNNQPDDALDSSINLIHGAPKNDINTISAGQVCRGSEFDGVDDYLEMPSVDTPNGLTVSAWIKNTSTTSWQAIVERGSPSSFGWHFYVHGGNKLYVSFGGGALYTPSGSIKQDTWHHVVATWDGVTVYVYVDGKEIASQPLASLNTEGDRIYTGIRQGSQHPFKGSMDEVFIARHALTQAQIQTVYENQLAGKNVDGTARSCSIAPIAEWQMDESNWTGAVDEVIDTTTSHFHGQAFGGTSTTTGKVCRAGDFSVDGTADYVLADPQALHGLNDFSISTWFKTPAATDNAQALVSGAAPGDNSNALLLWFLSSTRIRLDLDYRTGSHGSHTFTVPDFKDDLWHHLVWTRIADKNCIHLDGVNVGCTTSLMTKPLDIGGLVIGQEQDSVGGGFSAAQDFEGLIDEVAIYDHGLSPDQIINIYNNQNAGLDADGSLRFCPSGLVGDWYFDELEWTGSVGEVLDNSDTVLSGTAYNGAKTELDGKVCSGGVFDGLNDYVYIANNTTNQYSGGDMTISAWINIDAAETNGYIINKNGDYSLVYNGSNVVFSLGGVSVSAPVSKGQWYYITAVARQDKTVLLYVDGQLISTAQHSIISWAPGSIAVTMGSDYPYGQGWAGETSLGFKGKIDEVQFYQAALSANLIQQHYDNQVLGLNVDGTTRTCSVLGNPIVEWRMDEPAWIGTADEVKDNIGSHHGVSVSGVSTDLNAQICRAGDFDGVDDQVETASSVITDANGAYTVSVWVKRRAGDYGYVIANGGASSAATGFAITAGHYLVDRNYFQFFVRNSTHLLVLQAGTIVDNVWTHLVLSYDGNELTAYQDGALLTGTLITDTGGTQAMRSVHIGTHGGGTGYRFNGQIDEVQIFGTAVSATDIQSLYTNQAAGKNADGSARICPNYKVAEWHLEDKAWAGVADEVQDVIGGYHGTATSANVDKTSPAIATRPGTCGYGIFDGVDDKVDVAYDPALNTPNFTVSLWARVDGGAGTYRSPITSRNDVVSGSYGYFIYAGTDNKWQFWTGSFNSWNPMTGPSVVNGEWTHLAIRFKATALADVNGDYSGVKTLFVNGVAVATETMHKYRPNLATPLRIGAGVTEAGHPGLYWFNGAIDEVQYFDADLSNAAIAALATDTHPCPAEAVSEWRMDEFAWSNTADEVRDASGNNLHATPVGSVNTVDPGKICRAGDFTNGKYIEISDDAKHKPNHITVAAWVKPEGSFTHSWSTILMKSNAAWQNGYGLAHYTGGERVNFFINSYNTYKVSAILDPTVWSHVVGTYDGTHLKIYVNGVVQDSLEYSAPINHSTADLLIGRGTGSTSYFWDGQIDETRIYDDALTADEVISLMNETRTCAVKPNLIGEWRLDESVWQGFTGEVADNSGNSFHGTMTGGADTVAGQVCLAGNFEGTNSQIQIADDATFEGNAHTITAWVKASSWGGNMVSKDDNIAQRQWLIGSVLANGRIRAHIWTDTGAHIEDSATIVATDEWHHLAQVWDNDKLYLYIDGVLDANFPINATGNLLTGTQPVRIGVGSGTSYFDGQIDEVRYYDAGLDVSAIRNVMNETHPCELSCQVDSTDQLLFEDDFNDGDYAGWRVKNLTGKQCDWSVVSNQLSEATNACKGSINNTLNTQYQNLTNYTLQVDVTPHISGTNNGVGIMFGYINENNYYLARWLDYSSSYSSNATYRDFELLKVINGTSTMLNKRDAVSLPDNFKLTVTVSDSDGIDVFVDCDRTQFNLHVDNEAPPIKEFGLYTYDNDSRVYYDNIKVYGAAVKQLIGEWRFDEASWNGNASEVLDSSRNLLHGTAIGGAVTAGASPAIGGATTGTCGYGVFDGHGGNSTASHVRLSADDRLANISDGITLSGWAKPTVKGSYNTLISSDGGWASFERGYSLSTYNETPTFVIRDEFGHLQRLFGTGTMPTNEWHHLAGTFDGTQMKVYVDGVLKGTKALTNKIGTPTTFNTALGGLGLNPSVYNFTGSLDELRIYNYGLTETEINTVMNTTRICGTPYIDYFTVSHDTSGINCLNETILVNAYDTSKNLMKTYNGTITLDTQTGRGTWVSTSGAGIFIDAVPDDGLATYTFSTVDKGVTTFQLSYKEGPSPINIDVYDGAKRDKDNEGLLGFFPTGFILTASQVSNPPPANINDPIAVQTSGQNFSVHITAFGQDSGDAACGVIESYTGNKSLRLWSQYRDPVTGSKAAKINNLNIPTSSTSATRTVAFVNGQAEVTANYPDAGMMSLHFYDTNTPYNLNTSSNNFVVKPDRLTLSVVRTSDSESNPGAINAAGDKFMIAGDDFTVTVTAKNTADAATPNFGKESTPETITIDHSLLAPVGGSLGTLNGTATLALTGGGIFSGTFNYSEVGIISLAADITDGQYLGTTNLSISETVGRFVPDHFTASNLQTGALNSNCSFGGFSYTGQSFGYLSGNNPTIDISAVNALGAVTINYSDSIADFAKLAASSVTITPVTEDATTLGADGTTKMAIVHSQGTQTITELSGGLFQYGLGSDSFTYSRNSNALVGAFNADIDLIVSEVRDSDSVRDNFDPANKPTLEPTTNSIRYGRIRMDNVHGSELLDLVMPMAIEMYDGGQQDFVINTADSCTTGLTVTATDISGSDSLDGSTLSHSLQLTTTALLGLIDNTITAPGENNTGSALFTLTPPGYLQYNWGKATDPNTTATATFGIYQSNPAVIFTREIY